MRKKNRVHPAVTITIDRLRSGARIVGVYVGDQLVNGAVAPDVPEALSRAFQMVLDEVEETDPAAELMPNWVCKWCGFDHVVGGMRSDACQTGEKVGEPTEVVR